MASAPDWEQVRQWRASTRRQLLEARQRMDPRERRLLGEEAKQRLRDAVSWPREAVLGIYWPIRGEIDVLDIARGHIDGGGIVALPVVTRKDAPVQFWRWDPLMKMERGFWNIPVPAVAEPVQPQVLVIPLVGFDAAGYRLGYGGGYYDRTLAQLAPRPLRIGLGHAGAALPSIHPQPHDIPMDFIVTEADAREVALPRPALPSLRGAWP